MLQTATAPVASELALAPGVALARARTHEAAGPSRAVFALLAAARTTGPLLWIHPAWAPERPMGDGISPFLDPARLVFVRTRKPAEILWAAEEALRSGEVALVVADLLEPPELLAVRRLHLAAETGALGPGEAPLALLLTPGAGGAPGVETRWHLAPVPGWAAGGGPRWRLARTRARMAPEACWQAWLEHGALRLAPAAP
ncbi:hypothetical protein, partial [Amaricoccus sp.]|uniref:ImuA family protein n=1 Tax=Amaricoccus sp. TaxID=1872485 RepID=UPI00262D0152